jgi:serine/threonine-protein kinase
MTARLSGHTEMLNFVVALKTGGHRPPYNFRFAICDFKSGINSQIARIYAPMPLSLGSRLGTYQIVAAIGAGGMGEVYRARDTMLDRDVAIKVLPDAFARDASRMARFGREAKVLAALDHPNIAAIYGLEDSGDTRALVMQLAEGPTLAERIARGPIPIEEALSIARQIAEALEYAHERGIIHRDLKPANVKVAADDTVKVLDFGLAKAVEPEISTEDASNSPTMSRMATQAGVLLGTAAYMSPEQAKGKTVDRRADIWAFGCVLYEMLTGTMAFQADTTTEILAAVIKEEPDWSRLPAATPTPIRVLLKRCLQKDARQRLRDIGDARISLDEDLAVVAEAASRAGHHTVLFSIGALLVGAAIAGLAVWKLKPSPPLPRPVTRFTITLPPDQRLAELPQSVLALSPDGTKLAYVAVRSAVQQIYLRYMDNPEAKPVAGTEGAADPFFSPDGESLGFFANGKLKTVSIHGGAAQSLADAANSRGASWGDQGIIAFDNFRFSGLQLVPDRGGAAQTLDSPKKIPGEINYLWPNFLPGSKAVIFAMFAPNNGIVLQQTGTREVRNLISGQPATSPHYVPSGHLVYEQAGNLMAVPFDLKQLQVVGTPVSVLQGVIETPLPPGAQYSVSNTGSLVYVSGNSTAIVSRLVWVSRSGIETPLAEPPHGYDSPRISPDGRRIAVNMGDAANHQIWLYDIGRETMSRFTYEGNSNQWPVWTGDGKHIIFQSDRNIFWQLADQSGGLERLTDGSDFDVPFSASSDGQLLLFIRILAIGDEVSVMRLSDRTVQHFASPVFEDAPQISPDGHWMAYASEESGRREIYVQPFPGTGGKRQVSAEGGTEPQWNPNGHELFYRDGDKMMAVDINTQDGFAAGKARELFQGNYLRNPITYARPNYDVSRDGQRFLMLKPIDEHAAPTQINVVLNWTEELKRLVPTGSK